MENLQKLGNKKMEVREMKNCSQEFMRSIELMGGYIQQYKANGKDMLYIVYPILEKRGEKE